MSLYHISKNEQQIGPLTESELSTGFLTGRFSSTDLVWKVGTSDWVPLCTIIPPPLPQYSTSAFLPQQVSPNALHAAVPTKEKTGCLSLIGYGFLVIILLGVFGAIFGDSKSDGTDSDNAPLTVEQKEKEAFRKANNGNIVISNAFEGTTFQKEQYQQKHLGKRYFFKGKVDDVESERVITVMLDGSNHANVTFQTEDVSGYKEGKVVYFSAVIEAFGTGILINHDLGEAKLEDL